MKSDFVVLWEAHRGGGGRELPESTPAGFEYAWRLGGVPEADVNVTSDGVMMSFHDGTLDRTARVLKEEWRGKPLSGLLSSEVRSVDIGNDMWPGQHVPAIDELLARLRTDPAKEIIIDYKAAPLGRLAALIRAYGVERQVTFATTDETVAAEFRRLAPKVRIKIWIGGPREAILRRFYGMAERNFGGFEQIQLHLAPKSGQEWPYALAPEEIRCALALTEKAGVLLQLFVMEFSRRELFALLDLGIRSFAVDYPHRFTMLMAEYEALNGWSEFCSKSDEVEENH